MHSGSSDAPTADAAREPLHVLRTVFGFDAFRPNQEPIVRDILEGRDVFVVMPTGGGKSLCYQLPAHILPGTCLVISPLISLMKDQVDAACALGLRAAFLNSSLPAARRAAVTARLRAGELDLLYISPERFAMEGFIEQLQRIRLSFAAIDEAHCVSEWGHDFRPEYLELRRIVEVFPALPVAAFTATATARVQADIVARLGLRSPRVVRASFNRPNLFYRVRPKGQADRQIADFVRARAGTAGIVYRTTRKAVEQTAAHLTAAGLRALPYHAGLDDAVRAAHQDAFNRDDVDVIVATVAFGMGIDKSNVRYVLHGDLPRNMEGYYQETGRAGRDGDPAECLLLFGFGDIPKIRFFINQISDEQERAHAGRCLQSMVKYATVHACRRRQLLGYFGETLATGACEGCDVCAGEVESVDATRDAQIVLSAVARTGGRFGAMHIVDVVVGADTQRVRDLGHDRIKTHGAGRDRDKSHWRLVIDTLLAQGHLALEDSAFPVLQLGASAQGVLFGGERVSMVAARKQVRVRAATAEVPGDPALFEVLRKVRKELAAALQVPPFVVFSDRSLHAMAHEKPVTTAGMARIHGVGAAKLERYGPAFLEAIRAHEAAAS